MRRGLLLAGNRELHPLQPVSRHDFAAIWVAFFLKMAAISLLTGYTGNDGHGVTNATVEDVTVESFTTQNLFFMAPNAATKRPSRDITVRNLRCNVRQPKPTRLA